MHVDLGKALWDAGRGKDAVKEFEEALAIDPDNADAHVGLGTALDQQERPDEAFVHYQDALAIKPDCVDAYVNLGALSNSREKSTTRQRSIARPWRSSPTASMP